MAEAIAPVITQQPQVREPRYFDDGGSLQPYDYFATQNAAPHEVDYFLAVLALGTRTRYRQIVLEQHDDGTRTVEIYERRKNSTF